MLTQKPYFVRCLDALIFFFKQYVFFLNTLINNIADSRPRSLTLCSRNVISYMLYVVCYILYVICCMDMH